LLIKKKRLYPVKGEGARSVIELMIKGLLKKHVVLLTYFHANKLE